MFPFYNSCAYNKKKIAYELKTKVKLIGELLKWGYSEARVQQTIKPFSKINEFIFKNKRNHFQKEIKPFPKSTTFSKHSHKTNKIISKTNKIIPKNKQNHS